MSTLRKKTNADNVSNEAATESAEESAPPHVRASYVKTGPTLDRELFDASDELAGLADEIDIAAAATESDLEIGRRDHALGVVLDRIRDRVMFVANVVASAAKKRSSANSGGA